MTISLTLNDIPEFLKDSELCKNIESVESFDIPIELFRKELIINTFQDLIDYIKIFDYWMINNTPYKFYDWVFKNKDKIIMDLLNDQFPMNDLINQIKIIIDTTNYNICYIAAKNNFLTLLKYAHKNNYFWDEWTCIYASDNGHLDCLKYAHENGCPWYNKICHTKHLDCLKYAHTNGCDLDADTCSYFAKYGYLDCLKYAHENGCEWDEWTCLKAAENGHLDCLKYAYENGCEWDEYTCSYAAEHGHLDCLKYAHENGCKWDTWTCLNASENGHLECLKYAYENKCHWQTDDDYYNIVNN